MRRLGWMLGAVVPAAMVAIMAAPAAKADSGCPATKKKSGLGSFLGGLAGDAASRHLGSMGMGSTGYQMSNKVNSVLSDAIACRLSPEEREKAAAATNRAVERPVGATERWQSDTRPASGSSTITAQTKLADGATCKDVRDVATIDGEEQTITKRMCRAPGQTAWKMQVGSA